MNTDYKHIRQVLERYWECETSLSEEAQLREFFLQDNIPADLMPYKDFFVYQYTGSLSLGKDFDERVLSIVETPVVVKAKKTTLTGRLSPLFKAVAMVAIVVFTGSVVRHYLMSDKPSDYNYDTYTDTYTDPEVAYEQVSSALMILSEGLNKPVKEQLPDSVRLDDKELRQSQ